MKPQKQFASCVFIILLAWADCADVLSCASMKSWFPGTSPQTFADNLPYELSVTGYVPDGESIPRYHAESSHTVYLNGSLTADEKMRSFIGFIVYAENSVKSYANGHFVPEDFPSGVEAVNCSTLQLVQNSTSDGNWTSLKLIWKAPKDWYYAGNITFSASVLLQTNPPIYYEGFKAQLRYACPLRKCVACPGQRYKYDSYGCRTCQCSDSCDFACAEIYAPVCGTDDKTYSNKCSMEREACEQEKKITVASDGECGGCDFVCGTVYKPVCGTDGKTYGNECSLKSKACEEKNSVSLAHKGDCNSCDFACAEIYAPVCGTDDKTYSNKCSMEREACEQKKKITVASDGECGGCDFVCGTVYKPVCGTDGKTYSNECSLKSKACEEKNSVSLAHKSECNGASTLGFPGISFMLAFLAFVWFSV